MDSVGACPARVKEITNISVRYCPFSFLILHSVSNFGHSLFFGKYYSFRPKKLCHVLDTSILITHHEIKSLISLTLDYFNSSPNPRKVLMFSGRWDKTENPQTPFK